MFADPIHRNNFFVNLIISDYFLVKLWIAVESILLSSWIRNMSFILYKNIEKINYVNIYITVDFLYTFLSLLLL